MDETNLEIYETRLESLAGGIFEDVFGAETVGKAKWVLKLADYAEVIAPSWVHALANGNIDRSEDVLIVAKDLFKMWTDLETVE